MELDKDFREFLKLLNVHKVKYLVVGGYSVAHYGYPRYTGDIDLWIKPSRTNGDKLINVIDEFGFGALGLEPSDFMIPDKIIQFGVAPLRIDILTSVSGLGSFDDAYTKKTTSDYDGMGVHFIGYNDLIKNKIETNRGKDRVDVEELERVNNKSNRS